MDSNLVLLFGRARALVLDALYQAADSGVALHLREIARRIGLSPSAVQYELRFLRQLGLIKDIGTESRPSYVLNNEHVFFEDLRAMFTRTHTGLLADDAHFARKRVQQREDRRHASEVNSPLLRRHKR
jgi:DNA-binding Lrp family transcriptional regulator